MNEFFVVGAGGSGGRGGGNTRGAAAAAPAARPGLLARLRGQLGRLAGRIVRR